jgi:hypothetical protein
MSIIAPPKYSTCCKLLPPSLTSDKTGALTAAPAANELELWLELLDDLELDDDLDEDEELREDTDDDEELWDDDDERDELLELELPQHQ